MITDQERKVLNLIEVGKGDIVLQTEQVLKNLQSVLEASGTSLAHVVKVTVFLRNMEHRNAVAEVRKCFFKDNLPASTLVEISKLAHLDWLIEIEAIAVVPREVLTFSLHMVCRIS